MNPFIFALCVVFPVGCLCAETSGWQPSPGHKQVLIWPGAVPDARPVTGPEVETTMENLVAGRPWVAVSPVSRTYDDRLFTGRKEHGCCGGRVSWRRLLGSGHRS